MNDIIKKYPEWLQNMYDLNFWDIKEYLDKIKKENDSKKIDMVKPMGLKEFREVISFRSFDNDILNVMIKNKNIEVDTIKEQLKFIEKYEVYLVKPWDVKDCESWKKMLHDNLDRLKVEIQFLTELLK